MLKPVPQIGQPGEVSLLDIPLQVVEGTYKVTEAQRFANKQSIAALKYDDFNPYETAWDAVSFAAGYGLPRYSDISLRSSQGRRLMYKESANVDCRMDGLATLSTRVIVSATTLAGARPLWIGEYTPVSGILAGQTVLVVVAGNKVYTVDVNLTFTPRITLPDTPRLGAIGAFNGRLVIGYGASRTAQWSDDLSTLNNVQNSTPSSLYVFAFVADRASAYVAGGPNATDVNKVTSSLHGGTGYTKPSNAVTCGTSESEIVSLAPGGGVSIVFVGKETELGAIDEGGIYRQLVPFDSNLSTNCRNMRWWLGQTDEAQRGPVVLFFPREHALWSYQPRSGSTGSAQNISPWAHEGIRPPNARGIVTAIQGTARWMYFAIRNAALARTWIIAQDARTGAHHTWLSIGDNQVQTMTTTSLFGFPALVLGYEDHVAYVQLPLDGDAPIDSPGLPYADTGTLDLPDIDLDFPDEQKILFVVRIIADNLLAGQTSIEVQASYDGGPYTSLGICSESPVTELSFPSATSVRRVSLRLVFTTYNQGQTPQLRAVVLRSSINPRLYTIWNFQVKLPTGLNQLRADELLNPQTTIGDLWTARRNGTPVAFQDRWNVSWTVRILEMSEQETLSEPAAVPETVLDIHLLEVARTAGTTAAVYESSLYLYEASDALYSGAADEGGPGFETSTFVYEAPDAVYA